MTPTGASELARAEDQRAHAGADGQHGQLHAEHGVEVQRFHDGGHGRVECGERHVEHDEHGEERQHARIGEHIALVAVAAVRLEPVEVETIRGSSGTSSTVRSGTSGRQSHVRIVGIGRDDRDFAQYRRLCVAQREEHGTADRAGDGRHEQLRYGVHGRSQERRQNRSEDEYDFVDGGFERVRGVEQLPLAGAVEHIRPTGTYERAERELRHTHDHGQYEQQRNRHAHQCGEREAQHDDDLHRQYHRTDLALAEPVEQARVQRCDGCGGEHVCGAHHAGDRPIVVHVVEREHDTEAHHGHRQSRDGSGHAERLRAGNAEKLRVWRLRFLRFVRFVRLRLRFRARHAVTFPR